MLSADGSVGSPHVRSQFIIHVVCSELHNDKLGHRQALNMRKPFPKGSGFFLCVHPAGLWGQVS